MGENIVGKEGQATFLRDMILAVSVFSLPNIFPSQVGWLQGITPLIVFYCIAAHGSGKGLALITKAFFIATGLALLWGSLNSLFFSMALVPLGFSLAYSAQTRIKIEKAALHGTLALCIGYIGFWLLTLVLTRTNAYQLLVEAYVTLGKSEGLPNEVIQNLEYLFQRIISYIPLVLPGILLTTIICQVWLNLGLGCFLFRRSRPELIPWPELRDWKMSDQLVWGLIGSTVALFMPTQGIQVIGFNLLMIFAVLYLFQGFAVIAYLLNKWHIPFGFRALIYILFLVQGYGLLVIAVVGLSDVWADYRKPRNRDKNPI